MEKNLTLAVLQNSFEEPKLKYVLLIIDMQQATFGRPTPIFDATGLVERINSLANRVRADSGRVILIQFSGPPGTPYDRSQDGWKLVPELNVESSDLRFSKTASDAFQSTNLETILGIPSESRLIVTGCDTEFCVDSTIRSALARDYDVTVPDDGHSLSDRPHLNAEKVIEHHNNIWSAGALARPVRVCKCAEIL